MLKALGFLVHDSLFRREISNLPTLSMKNSRSLCLGTRRFQLLFMTRGPVKSHSVLLPKFARRNTVHFRGIFGERSGNCDWTTHQDVTQKKSGRETRRPRGCYATCDDGKLQPGQFKNACDLDWIAQISLHA